MALLAHYQALLARLKAINAASILPAVTQVRHTGAGQPAHHLDLCCEEGTASR